MLKPFRLLLLLCVMSLAALPGQALHIKGGWMYYTFIGENNGQFQYRVYVKVYRDCAPPNPGQNDIQINLTVFNNNATSSRIGDFSAPLTNTRNLRKESFSECINPRPEVCYVILEYETIVTLPASADGYTISFQRCCRINGIVNILQPSNNLGNTYSITIPGTLRSASHPRNNSPEFSMRDTLLVCFNSPIQLDYSATDPDGDSLVYSFTDAFIGASQANPNPTTASAPPYSSLPYASGFTSNNPFGTNLVINQRTGIITGTSPGVTGEYVLAVRVDEYRGGVLIASTRKELHVNVANCAIAAARLPIRITTCDGFTVNFANESTSPAILSYFWDFGVTTLTSDTSTSAFPTFTYPDTGVYIAKLVVNRGSACSDSATTEVRVFPGFFPGFVADGSCFSNPFDFRDTTRTRFGVVNFWRWDFGNTAVVNDTSRLRNPSYTYPSPGTYNATLIVGSSKGCLDTVVAPVTVFDRPALTLSPDTLKCSPDTILLLASGRGSFTWDPSPTLLDRFSGTPRVFPRDTTTYYVTLNDRGCIARDSIRVNVLDFITVDAGPDTTICLTDEVQMRPTSFATSYRWTPAPLFSDPTAKFPNMLPTAASTRVFVTANLGTCQDRDSLLVRTVPYPQAAAGLDTTICFGAFATLRGTAVAAFYNWTPAGQVVNPTQLVSNTRTLTSTTSFTLTVRDTLGCPKPVTDVVQVTVRPRINIFAGNDTTVVINQPLQLNAVSNGLLFNWSPGTGLSSTRIVNPVAIFRQNTLPANQETIRYVVTASTPEGCEATDDIVVRIFKTAPSIFVPSAFTPNRDGLNDVIRPILAGIQRLDYFRVYNRWGQLVFETSRDGAGWDGRVKGQDQGSGAFVYQCQATDYLGNTLRTKGSFVLIR